MSEFSRIGYRPDLQGLRALAVALVVASHFGFSLLEGGFLGVDVFFVLSGFLITRLLVREIEATGTLNLARFYARRIKRLFPAMLLMVYMVFVTAIIWLPGAGLRDGLSAAPYALTWTSNLFFDFRQLGYFDSLDHSDFFLHTWSLAVEEQFYLAWPLLLLFLTGPLMSGRLSVLRLSRARGMLAIALGGFVVCMWIQGITINSAFYQMPARIWEFAAGGFCAFQLRPCSTGSAIQSSMPKRVGVVFSFVGIVLIAVSACLFNERSRHPGMATLGPVVGTALVILGGAQVN